MISVVIPAYNASKYIVQAIDSIRVQSYTDWEIIIVNDCSTDNTRDIVIGLQKEEPRIKLYDTEKNSGGCRIPRLTGAGHAAGEFILSIDSDDFVEGKYIEKLYNRLIESDADIVLGRMVLCEEDGTLLKRSVPREGFDMSAIYSGYDACKLTIGGWKLAMNGMLVKSALYKAYISDISTNDSHFGYIDEIDHRKLLFTASRIAMDDAHYYYRQLPDSIVHNVSLKSFDRLVAQDLLFEFVQKNYAEDRVVMADMYYEYIGTTSQFKLYLLKHSKKLTAENKKKANKRIRESYKSIKENKMQGKTLIQKISALNYPLFVGLQWIKYIGQKSRILK